MHKKKAPTPKWMLSRKRLNVLTNTAYPVGRRGRHFYFHLFLLSRKVSNAMMKPPKEINKAKIPKKTIIISYAVIYATSLLCIPKIRFHWLGRLPPCHGYFPI